MTVQAIPEVLVVERIFEQVIVRESPKVQVIKEQIGWTSMVILQERVQPHRVRVDCVKAVTSNLNRAYSSSSAAWESSGSIGAKVASMSAWKILVA